MTVNVATFEVLRDKRGRKYELIPPEGGWGHMVTLAIALTFGVTTTPIGVCGIFLGGFFRDLGDETAGIAITNSVFNTVLSATGLASNHLLQNYSCRKVGLLGAAFFFLGAFGSVFVDKLYQIIFTYGVLQGIGLGLAIPACYTSFNGYYDKRQTLMMSIAQTTGSAISMASPKVATALMDAFGWRGTQLILAGLSLHLFYAMLTLQPVKWHVKKRYLLEEPMLVIKSNESAKNGQDEVVNEYHRRRSTVAEPLLQKELHLGKRHSMHNVLERRRPSIIGFGNLTASVASDVDRIGTIIKPETTIWRKIHDGLDLGLFRDPVFINISIGLSLAMTADMAFLSLIPMILTNASFSDEERTVILTGLFAADLVGRVLLSIISGFVQLKNRILLLAGTLLMSTFRIAFVLDGSYLWVLITAAAIGSVRGLIQIPLPLVIADAYKDRFSSAFTLYMVVQAVIAGAFGPLIGYVKQVTESDAMVLHLLTFALLACAIPWIIEMTLTSSRTKKSKGGDILLT